MFCSSAVTAEPAMGVIEAVLSVTYSILNVMAVSWSAVWSWGSSLLQLAVGHPVASGVTVAVLVLSWCCCCTCFRKPPKSKGRWRSVYGRGLKKGSLQCFGAAKGFQNLNTKLCWDGCDFHSCCLFVCLTVRFTPGVFRRYFICFSTTEEKR